MGRTSLIAEYAYVLRPGGILYTVTDVKGTFHHMKFEMKLMNRITRMDGCPPQDPPYVRYYPK